MNATLSAPVTLPAVAIAGTWDPFLPDYEAMLQQLVQRSTETGRCAVAVMIDPSPTVFINGPQVCPLFCDAETRIMMLHHLGMDSVLTIHFSKEDLMRSVEDFFDLVQQHIPLQEFWLREGQTLGSGGRGNTVAILNCLSPRRIRLKVLKGRPDRKDLFQYLAQGRIQATSALVGRYPVVSRCVAGTPTLAWASGIYRVAPVAHPSMSVNTFGEPLWLELYDTGEVRRAFLWPKEVETPFLAFLEGPGDRATQEKGAPAFSLAA
jgi:hypothetical protein